MAFVHLHSTGWDARRTRLAWGDATLLSSHAKASTTGDARHSEIAGAQRFRSDAKLARAAGIAPIPVSSGNTRRHRLDRGGSRQINATIHRIAVTRLRCHAETKDYIARKRAQGKSTKDAIRCLKRHLVRRIWHLLQAPAPIPDQTLTPTTSLT